MNKTIAICIAFSVLILTMACAFVQNMIFPPGTSTPSPSGDNRTAEVSTLPVPKMDPVPITCSNDECLNSCLNRLDAVLETSSFDSISNSIYEQQDTNFNLVIYKVDGDQIKDPAILYVPPDFHKYQEDTAAHQRIWDFYIAIIPAELRAMVSEFVIYTDGAGSGSGAWVSQTLRDPDQWQVGFDLLDSDYPPYLADALIHETGHLLTINTAQMPFDDLHYYSYDEEQNGFRGCPQYAFDSACSLPDSYINLFYERFWKDIYAEWTQVELEAEDAQSFEEYLEAMEQFYEGHEALFLNSYAATNIREDMAESFSYFVLNPKPDGNSISEKKVGFYYEFPELVNYRHQIIEGLCAYVNE
jgi:hypothetical protein